MEELSYDDGDYNEENHQYNTNVEEAEYAYTEEGRRLNVV